MTWLQALGVLAASQGGWHCPGCWRPSPHSPACPGAMERVRLAEHSAGTEALPAVLVTNYAHTPDGLRTALAAWQTSARAD